MKHIDDIMGDIKEGDLVKIFFSGENNTYIGYCWHKSREDFNETNGDPSTNRPNAPTYGLRDADLFLNPLSPNGIDKRILGEGDDFCLGYKIQFLGIDTSRRGVDGSSVGFIPVLGYEILERSE